MASLRHPCCVQFLVRRDTDAYRMAACIPSLPGCLPNCPPAPRVCRFVLSDLPARVQRFCLLRPRPTILRACAWRRPLSLASFVHEGR